jgi:AAHS family 4-hydroxybenzoate transporter-like MFS transporter
MTALQIRVAVLCAFIILLDGFDLIVISVAAPVIATSLHLKVSALGPVLSIAHAGLMIGAMAFGTVADRVGRRWPVIIATVIFGVFTLATGFAGTFRQLLLCRFLAGVGLGGASPNVMALTAEYSPKHVRSGLVAAVWAALPLGGALSGLASSVMIERFGWPSLFYLGGVAPLLLALVLIAALPESPAATEPKPPGVPVKHLFTEGRGTGTLLLWVAFFTSFYVLVFVTAWSPTILRSHGITIAQVGLAIALNSVGSVIGSGSVGRLMDRFGAHRVLMIAFLAAAVATAVFGFAVSGFAQAAVLITLCGIFAGASQAGSIALSTLFYPVGVRSTGVGWAIALGRLGGVTSPLVGGMLLGWAWDVTRIFLVALAVPAICGAVCVWLVQQNTLGRRDAVPQPQRTLS